MLEYARYTAPKRNSFSAEGAQLVTMMRP